MASKSKFPPLADFPDLSRHNNYMAKHLTEQVYAKLRDVKTSSGFTFDECIQTGKSSNDLWSKLLKISFMMEIWLLKCAWLQTFM